MSCVPLPWCTSQSTIATRSMPSSACAQRAAIATESNRQKPIARSRSAWWPGGRASAKPSRRTASIAAPAASSAASNVVSRADGVRVEPAARCTHAAPRARECGSAADRPPSPARTRRTGTARAGRRSAVATPDDPVGWRCANALWLTSSTDLLGAFRPADNIRSGAVLVRGPRRPAGPRARARAHAAAAAASPAASGEAPAAARSCPSSRCRGTGAARPRLGEAAVGERLRRASRAA